MIGLDREMPQSCLSCPCLYTINLKGVSLRCCNAAGMQQIIEPLFYDKEKSVPDWWMNFEKPDWCPWVEV